MKYRTRTFYSETQKAMILAKEEPDDDHHHYRL